MRGKSVLWLAPLSLATVSGCSNASREAATTTSTSKAVAVRPAVGGRRTPFVVAFRAAAGRPVSRSLARRWLVTATGPRRSGCVSTAFGTATLVPPGSLAHVSLTAPSKSRGWCEGTYQGRVELLLAPVCAPGQACPTYIVNGGTIGRFSFRVK